jgi:NADH-quinone oxidoreductase subunit M
MWFVLLGVFVWDPLALHGAVVQMLAHGLTAGALFLIAGALRERLHTLDTARMGGLWGQMPRLAALGLLFAIATLGLPGFGNFIGEVLVLLGTFRVHPVPALVAVAGVITAAIYALALVQRTLHGPPHARPVPADCGPRETLALGTLAAASLTLGLHPQPVLDLMRPALTALTGTGG